MPRFVPLDRDAARWLGFKVSLLRVGELFPGMRFTGKNGRTATFHGTHPKGPEEFFGRSWWELEGE